jgi:RNase P/RNase MRP subunit POP5
MKALKPSHREHKRYLFLSGKDVSKEEIEGAILKFVGVLGWAKASPSIVKSESGKVILSVNRQELDKIRSAFLLSGKDIQVKKVSGMINKL